MALGGGTFISQNKVLPGTYINVVSAALDKNESARGIATIPLELDWGPEKKVFRVESTEFVKDAQKIFGYRHDDKSLWPVREIFKHAKAVYFYRLNSSENKASNAFAEAKYSGKRGNDIKIIIKNNIDDDKKYDVTTVLGAIIVDKQTVSNASELQDNDYVAFKQETTLAETVGTALSGGNNGTVTGMSHKEYMDAMESYTFNTMGVMTGDEDVKKVYAEYVKRMRDELGIKFQCVLYKSASDFEGVINVKNSTEIIPWITGMQAECEINRSCTNMLYDGELEVDGGYTQSELEMSIKDGEFVLHKCGTEIRVLMDINSLTSVAEDKNELFASNQTIRVIDYLATEIANLFNGKYIGKVLNNDNGRASLWADIVAIHKELMSIGAIEDFSDSDITILKGEGKRAVTINDNITVVGTMEQLYMTVAVQ